MKQLSILCGTSEMSQNRPHSTLLCQKETSCFSLQPWFQFGYYSRNFGIKSIDVFCASPSARSIKDLIIARRGRQARTSLSPLLSPLPCQTAPMDRGTSFAQNLILTIFFSSFWWCLQKPIFYSSNFHSAPATMNTNSTSLFTWSIQLKTRDCS